MNDKIKLVHGDCLEHLLKMPSKCVDLVVMDPPYLMQEHDGGGAFGSKKRAYHNSIDDLTNNYDLRILDELVRVMKKINIYIWCNKEQFYQYLDYFKEYNADLITWHKTNPVPTCNNKYLSDTEYLFFFREKGVPVHGSYHTKRKYYVTPTNKKDKELYNHPTVKPLHIIQNLIINSSIENDVVLDPFMGSGTTGAACIETNRRFIGIEIDDNYFNTAQERIKNHGENEKQAADKQINIS